MKIRVIGSTYEILHFEEFLKKSAEYTNIEDPSPIYPIEDGKDKGKCRCHFVVRQIFRPTTTKKKKNHFRR